MAAMALYKQHIRRFFIHMTVFVGHKNSLGMCNDTGLNMRYRFKPPQFVTRPKSIRVHDKRTNGRGDLLPADNYVSFSFVCVCLEVLSVVSRHTVMKISKIKDRSDIQY